MTITNRETGTRIDEVAARIYRISTPIPPSSELPPGFSFNQYLIAEVVSDRIVDGFESIQINTHHCQTTLTH